MVFMEKVQIVIDSIIKNAKSISETNKQMQTLAQTHRKLNAVIANPKLQNQAAMVRRYTKRLDSFRGVMSLTLPQMHAFNRAGGVMQTRMGKAAMGIRQFTHGLKGFRMEMLGVMFFGMMMMNFFKGLLRPAMDAFGVFDLWQDMLTVLFLPIMEKLFPMFLNFINVMMGLSQPVKLAIGVLASLGVVIGTLIFLIGSLVLGVGSMVLAFGALPAIVTGIILSMTGAILAITRMGIALLTLNGTAIVRELALMGAGFNALATTALGATAIIGAAFLAAYAISSKGLKDQGLEYKSVWAGILGTVVDAVVGIGVLLLGLGGVTKTILEIIWQSFKNTFTALGKAVWTWFKGGSFKQSFNDAMRDVDFGGILTKNLVPAGVTASATTGIKESLGLTQNIPKVEVNTTNNINVMDNAELQRMMDQNTEKQMDELRRMSTLS